MMPCHSDPQDEADARLAAEHFGVPTIRIDLAARLRPPARSICGRRSRICPPDSVRCSCTTKSIRKRGCRVANVKPRLRMTSLYFVANSLNYLVAGTGNRSELTIGYFTKYGDGGVDLLPIGRLLKSEVRALARELGVPATDHRQAAERRPVARADRRSRDGLQLRRSRALPDDGPGAVSPALAERIERLARASDHKRALPPMPHE